MTDTLVPPETDTNAPVLTPQRPVSMNAVLVPGLRAIRLDRALTQEELAHRARVGRKTVIRAESGQEIRISSARRLAAALRVSAARLQRVPPESH